MARFVEMCLLAVAVCIIAIVETGQAEKQKRDASNWKVTTIEEKPYVTLKDKDKTSPGNDDFEGYIPDLLKSIGAKLNQKYSLQLSKTSVYGEYTHGTWTGMIGEVKEGKVDLAAAPITISPARREVVDFTKPFMSFGTVILIRKPANDSTPLKTFQELVGQAGMKYGVIREGSTSQLIRTSSEPNLSRLREHLEDVDTQEKGIEKIRSDKTGKYAFILEANTAEFWVKREPCDLAQIPLKEAGDREYAFALGKGSAFTAKINQAIDELMKSGELDMLKARWWKNQCNGAGGKTVSGVMAAIVAVVVMARGKY